METIQAYFARKQEEARLLNDALERPFALDRACSIEAVIARKFKLAAALKAEHALQDWACTETAWGDDGPHSGPFRFVYDYQRADLKVRGPAVYPAISSLAAGLFQRTVYTCSGMAAISAVLMALERLSASAELVAMPGAYGETLELVERHGRNVRLVRATNLASVRARRAVGRVLLVDACLPLRSFEAIIGSPPEWFDLILFDTTGLWTSSGRVRRVARWALRAGVPLAFVRSHNKLDSLGVEYGRLGSVVFVGPARPRRLPPLDRVADEAADALRLFGGAAVPAHFPPFVGDPRYAALSVRRLAAILRNSRRMAKKLAASLPAAYGELDFAHRLYVALSPERPVDEQGARELADALGRDLGAARLPIRHAGSFGFDFAAAEWFRDTVRDRHVVRIAVPDLPTEIWDHTVDAIIDWWKQNVGKSAGQGTRAPIAAEV